MPAEQRGSVYKTSKGYGLRWYDEMGTRRRRAGFSSRSEARSWFETVERKRMRGEEIARPPVTLAEHVDRYLEVHAATRDPNTIRVLRERLRGPVKAYGDRPLRELERMAGDLAEWQTTLPERSRYGVMQALRQTLEAAVRWGDIGRNPAKLAGANPPPPPRGVQTFTAADVEKIAVELGKVYGPAIRFAAATGMRPEEWIALERQDVDRANRVARVQRTRVEGRTKNYGKTAGSSREVPLAALAMAAIDAVPARLDTRLVFYGPRGAHIDLRNFRNREWKPALEAAGLERSRRIYDLRSTFASHALAAGVSVFELGRIMGMSVRMIERHYGALLQGSGDSIRGKLDAFANGLGQEEATDADAEAAP